MEHENPAIDPLIGKIISERYRVLERVGRGGFGAVYKVQHIRLDKTLALKVLFEHTHQNPRMIKRFEREARATCRIGHDNIVEITDFARDRRVGYYFVMEYLVGETLSERLRKLGPIPGPRIVHIGCQIADALAATHAKGIVHRDLKPDNIFLLRKRHEEDFVKVLDFGIAAMGDFDEQGPRLTRHGAMLGTPAYMSPEQAEGKAADHRADIYSLGIILYEMATGKVPYRNAASMAVLEMHRSTEPVPPRQARPDLDIPLPLEQVVLRCLRKPVAQRYQSMREVYNDLVTVSQRLDMSSVASRRTDLRVDVPGAVATDEAEREEPEWLDEDLVLLEDGEAEEPGETVVLAHLADDQDEGDPEPTMPILDLDPTRVDRPFPPGIRLAASRAGGGNGSGQPDVVLAEVEAEVEAMVVQDDDIVASSAIEVAAVPVLATEIALGATAAAPAWTQPPDTHAAGQDAPVAGAMAGGRKPSTAAVRTAVRTTGGSLQSRPVDRSSASGPTRAPLWHRPWALILSGFLITMGAGALALGLLASPGSGAAESADSKGGGAITSTESPGSEPAAEEPAPSQAEPTRGAVVAAPPVAAEPGHSGTEPGGPGPAEAGPDLGAAAAERPAEDVGTALLAARREPDGEAARLPAGPATAASIAPTRRADAEPEEPRDRSDVEKFPNEVVVAFESTPSGALVLLGDEELGKTPFTRALARTEDKVSFQFRLDGYAPELEKVALGESRTVQVKLRKKKHGGGGGQRGGNTYDLF